MQFTRDDYQLVLDYDEFVDCWWIYVFNAVSGYDARLAAFTSGFPHWLQDPYDEHPGRAAVLGGRDGGRDDGRAGRPGGRHRPAAGDLRRGGHVRPGARAVVGLDPAVRGRG